MSYRWSSALPGSAHNRWVLLWPAVLAALLLSRMLVSMGTSGVGLAALIKQGSDAWKAAQHPLLGELSAQEIRAARTVVRCDRDGKPVAIVDASWDIVTFLGREFRTQHDQGPRGEERRVLAACRHCDYDTRYMAAYGRRHRVAEREMDALAVWRLATRRHRRINLKDVLAAPFRPGLEVEGENS